MFNLIKKDFIIGKKNFLPNIVITILMPQFIKLITNTEIPSGICILYTSIMLGMVNFTKLFYIEETNKNILSMLVVSGFSRKKQIISRFAIFLLFYIYVVGVYAIEVFFDNRLRPVTWLDVLLPFLIYVFVLGIYYIFCLKFGYKNSVYLYILVIFILSLFPQILSILNIKINFTYLFSMNAYVLNSFLAVSSIILLSIFITLSYRIYENKDL